MDRKQNEIDDLNKSSNFNPDHQVTANGQNDDDPEAFDDDYESEQDDEIIEDEGRSEEE